MNNKGFGLKEFIILFSVIFICMIVIMSIYQSIFPNQNIELEKNMAEEKPKTYKELEQELQLAAERYQNDTYSADSDATEVWTLSYSMLKEKKYIDKLIDPNDKNQECTGYVEFIQDEAKISYQPFLKCGNNYETKGYQVEN